MKEMIKKYRGSLICSFLVMLIGVLVGFTSTQSMWANVFFVVTDCALVAIIFYDNRNRQQSRKIIGMTMWIIPIITLLYNGIARLVNMGADIDVYKRQEYTYGESRIDFYMERDGERFLTEVKGCTLADDLHLGIGLFPDAPTERGVKHLHELTKAAKEGYHCSRCV